MFKKVLLESQLTSALVGLENDRGDRKKKFLKSEIKVVGKSLRENYPNPVSNIKASTKKPELVVKKAFKEFVKRKVEIVAESFRENYSNLVSEIKASVMSPELFDKKARARTSRISGTPSVPRTPKNPA